MRKGGRWRDHRTSKIGGRRKRREEQRREKEGRKEGRGRLGVLADERIDPRRVKHGICLCLPLSLSILAYVPPARVAAALPLSLSPPRALPSSLSTGRHQSPPLHSSHREPRPTAFSLTLIQPSRPLFPRAASSRPSHRYYALAPARQRQITLHFQSPKELQRPIPPSPVAPSRHLRSRSSSTAFHGTHLLRRPTILMPLSSFLPRPPPPPFHPRPPRLSAM